VVLGIETVFEPVVRSAAEIRGSLHLTEPLPPKKGQFNSPKDKEGAFLIDRSPDKFRVVLEYLRTGVLDIPKGITMCVFRSSCRSHCLSNQLLM